MAERKDVLSAFFWLLTMWAYVGYVRNPGLRRYALVLICFSLGLMAKPMLVTLPLVLLLWDYWPLRRWAPQGAAAAETGPPLGNFPYPRISLKRLVWEKIPLFILVVLFSLVAVYAQKAGAMVVSLADIPLGARISNALVAYVTLPGKDRCPPSFGSSLPSPGKCDPLVEGAGGGSRFGLCSP